MNTRRFPEILYTDIDPDDLTVNHCYSAITKLKMYNITSGADDTDSLIRTLERNLADFLDHVGRYQFDDDSEIIGLFDYIPDHMNLSAEKIERLLISDIPEGYFYRTGRVYRFIDHVIIPHTYRQYWLLMCLNTTNYDLQHINNFLSRQLHLSSVKFQFLSTFKNVVRQNWHQLLKSGVQSYLYEWIDKHQKSLKVEIKVTAKVLIKINAEELLQFFINEFEKIQENLTPILLPDQVERFFYANFSSNPPTGVLDKFHISKKHEDDIIRIFRMFHESYIKDKSSRTAYTIDLIYNNFHMNKLRKSTVTNFNKYV